MTMSRSYTFNEVILAPEIWRKDPCARNLAQGGILAPEIWRKDRTPVILAPSDRRKDGS